MTGWISVSCRCPEHKGGVVTFRENAEDLDYFLNSLRERGCFPIVREVNSPYYK